MLYEIVVFLSWILYGIILYYLFVVSVMLGVHFGRPHMEIDSYIVGAKSTNRSSFGF